MTQQAAQAEPTGPATPAPPIPFGRRLTDAIAARGRLCVGIDPHPHLLREWGLGDDADGLRRFALTVVEAVGEVVAVVKPQVAFFERHGSAGVAVLEEVLAAAGETGTLTIADAKRGDIGSTMAAYADAFAGPGSPLAADAVTASPYLGYESLRPLLDLACATGRGVFVLARTSNPEGGPLQQAVTSGGTGVAASVVAAAAADNAGAHPLGGVGVVVGATVPDAGRLGLDALNGPVLAPGLGAQGARAEDLRAVFGDAWRAVLPSSSREVLGAGPEASALRAAAERTRDEIAAALG